ncbi:MAG TPA: phosphatase PAP2 family protein [Candidatus Brocadiia bacterium]|nr:phosphatase PAP2 family protein [Candidatus Brocadiia bacterium]
MAIVEKRRPLLNPFDRLALISHVFALAVIFFCWRALPSAGFVTFKLGSFVIITPMVARVCRRLRERAENPTDPEGPAPWHAPGWHFFHGFMHVMMVGNVYEALGDCMPHVIVRGYDAELAKIDTWLLGGRSVAQILDAHIYLWLSDFLFLGYCLYFIYPSLLMAMVALRKDMDTRFIVGFTLVLNYYVMFVFYFCTPASGPRMLIADTAISEGVFNLMNRLEKLKFDAFPSGHVCTMVIATYLAFRYYRAYFLPGVIFTAMVIAATIYCRYHYAIDVICGMVMAWVVCAGAPSVMTAIGGRAAGHANPPARKDPA